MNYREALDFIEGTNQYGSKLGLETIRELLSRLGNPQEQLKVIHVAGTNGKGSTSALIAAILTAEGYLVGRYNSPAVFSYREIIRIGSECITEEGVCTSIETIKAACEAMVNEGHDHPTPFEVETAMAFLYLAKEQVDFAVIEVGLGGRLDATNVITRPICSVITSISMDHMQYLGDTLEEITAEKAGIIKQGVPVVTCNHSPKVLEVLKKVCIEQDAKLVEVSKNITEINPSIEGTSFTLEHESYTVGLLGEYQIANAALAITTTKCLRDLGYPISNRSMKEGLLQAKWGGRLEILARNPYFIIDGAHNEDAALSLKASLLTLFPGIRKIFIMGVLADKDYQKILQITAPLASVIITVTPKNSRALDAQLLAKEAKKYTDVEILPAESVERAINYAYQAAGKEDLILAFGSLSYLCEIKANLPE